MDHRYGKVKWGPQGKRVRTSAALWKKPLQWNNWNWYECNCGWRGLNDNSHSHRFLNTDKSMFLKHARARVFCSSLADVFENKPDQREEMSQWREDLFKLIEATPNLDWLLLTKRPENVISMTIWNAPGCRMPDNVWIGTSVENQKEADERIPKLLKVPAKIRFLSCEPLLEPVDLFNVRYNDYNLNVLSRRYSTLKNKTTDDGTWGSFGMASLGKIDWVISGGESGPKARPVMTDWIRSLRDQCQQAGTPYHFKQWGEWSPCIDRDGLQTNDMVRLGKHAAGRLLDGREWNEFPS